MRGINLENIFLIEQITGAGYDVHNVGFYKKFDDARQAVYGYCANNRFKITGEQNHGTDKVSIYTEYDGIFRITKKPLNWID